MFVFTAEVYGLETIPLSLLLLSVKEQANNPNAYYQYNINYVGGGEGRGGDML